MAVAAAPSRTKIVEKPRTKATDEKNTVRRPTVVGALPVSWSRLTPAR